MYQGYSSDTAGVDRGYIRSSIRAVNFLPDRTRPSHKNWLASVRGWSGVGWLSGVNEALSVTLYALKEMGI